MVRVGKILVEDDVLASYFKCDLNKCKGGCCTFPGALGASLLDSEIEPLSKALKPAMKYLSEKSKEYIDKYGYTEGNRGDKSTMCIEHKDCVFVFYENDIAKCALEKAYFKGESDFRKPISCHLFPIRVGNNGRTYLYYEKIDECAPGVELGNIKKVKLVESLHEALIREFDMETYKLLNKNSPDSKLII